MFIKVEMNESWCQNQDVIKFKKSFISINLNISFITESFLSDHRRNKFGKVKFPDQMDISYFSSNLYVFYFQRFHIHRWNFYITNECFHIHDYIFTKQFLSYSLLINVLLLTVKNTILTLFCKDFNVNSILSYIF